MRPKVIFFDIGNTLVTGSRESARRLFAARLGLSEKDTRRLGRLIMTHRASEPSEIVDAISLHIGFRDHERLQAAVVDIWREQRACVRTIPGAISVLRLLKQEGFKIGIISNTWQPSYMGFQDACRDVAGIFDYEILSFNLSFKKPSLEPFLEGLRLSGEKAENCWMVGDTLELDVIPAQQAGMKAIWVMRQPEREKDLLVRIVRRECPPPDWAVEHLNEIVPFFKALGDF